MRARPRRNSQLRSVAKSNARLLQTILKRVKDLRRQNQSCTRPPPTCTLWVVTTTSTSAARRKAVRTGLAAYSVIAQKLRCTATRALRRSGGVVQVSVVPHPHQRSIPLRPLVRLSADSVAHPIKFKLCLPRSKWSVQVA